MPMDRRTFLKTGSMIPIASALGTRTRASAAGTRREIEGQISVAVIGFGFWGREIATTLERMPEVRLAAIVDTYDVMLTRAERAHPAAARKSDYRQVLDDASITTIVVATPTHLHRQIVEDALAAGKHVYCEAPLAATVEDARAIAKAAASRPAQIFQSGLLMRSHPEYRSVFQFIRSGALGLPTMARAQWHRKESWRRASPNRQREIEQNWRLDGEVSIGLVGELGIQQFDSSLWMLDRRPESITGFGQIMLWDDGRDVPDTVQTVNRAGSSALVANATSLDAQGIDPAADDPDAETPLYYRNP
jgi:predicted dehydrogenase